MGTILKLTRVSKTYATAAGALTVLAETSLSVKAGDSLAVVGPSGSGKTTLLGLCAGLDQPTSGSVELCGQGLEGLDEDGRAAVRGRSVGFVFQNFQLVPTLTALENVMVPLELMGAAANGAAERAGALLERVGLAGRRDHYPVQLSGGEQQRVGLARAFINRPAVLFADEPTGNLDGATGAQVEDLLFELNREAGTTLVLVSHDPELAARTGRTVRLQAGRVVEEVTR